MRTTLTLLLAATGLLQAPQSGLVEKPMGPPLDGLKLLLPQAYEADKLISRKFTRAGTPQNPDVVYLRIEYYPAKMPEVPVAPTETDLMKVDSTLGNLKVTPSVGAWRGRQVPMARYEGFLSGRTGVYGRMVWLPLQPGTVVLHIYAEPNYAATMEQDWNVILANITAPIAELTLRERAPGRWLASKITATLGILVAFAGIILILARMNEAIGGAVVYLGLLLPVFPLGYAVLHIADCWRGLLVCCSGLGIFGVSILLER